MKIGIFGHRVVYVAGVTVFEVQYSSDVGKVVLGDRRVLKVGSTVDAVALNASITCVYDYDEAALLIRGHGDAEWRVLLKFEERTKISSIVLEDECAFLVKNIDTEEWLLKGCGFLTEEAILSPTSSDDDILAGDSALGSVDGDLIILDKILGRLRRRSKGGVKEIPVAEGCALVPSTNSILATLSPNGTLTCYRDDLTISFVRNVPDLHRVSVAALLDSTHLFVVFDSGLVQVIDVR